MQEKQIGKYLVVEHENFSDILRKPEPNESSKHITKQGMILADEVIGKNHFAKACKKATLWHEADNPSQEKIELNRKLVALTNKNTRLVSDDYYLSLPLKEMKKEILRLENISQ
jgi:hypothetical protein